MQKDMLMGDAYSIFCQCFNGGGFWAGGGSKGGGGLRDGVAKF